MDNESNDQSQAWTTLFSSHTWDSFVNNGSKVVGYSQKHGKRVSRININDRLFCYVVGRCVWTAALTVVSRPFTDSTPLFEEGVDPYSLRLEVKPIVLRDLFKGVRIDNVWSELGITKNQLRTEKGWAYRARLVTGPLPLTTGDARVLLEHLSSRVGR